MRAVFQMMGAALALASVAVAAFGQDKMPWQANLEMAQRVAAQSNRLVLIHFWAPWCRPCMRLEQDVFANPETAKALEANFVMVKLNTDDAPGTARLYGVSSLPSDVITTPQGRLVSQMQSPSTMAQYVAQMNQAAAGHRSLARKPDPQSAQQMAPATAPGSTPPPNTGAAYAAPYPAAPGAALPPASYPPSGAPQAAGNDRYAEYFVDQPNGAQQPRGQVTPAQAYTAVPGAAPTSPYQPDPYSAPGYGAQPPNDRYATAPAAEQPPAVDRYATSTPQPPNDPYATAPAAGQPPAADPYATTPVTPQPPNDPYAVAGPPPDADPYAVTPAATQPPPATAPYQAPLTQAATAQASYQPQQPNIPQLPPGCPSVGLDGNCPVTLVERKRWVLGHPAYGAVHRGRTYLFMGPQEKDKFLADPDRYSPIFSGFDPVLALENQKAVPGRREFGVFGADGHIYLFADEASRTRFEQNEKHYAAQALQAVGGNQTLQAMRPGR